MAKVKFGLSNVHIFPITETNDEGVPTYGEPFRLPGAVSMTIDPAGNEESFYADNVVYYRAVANSGYTGTFEVAMINDAFKEQILGQRKDSNGVFIETSDDRLKEFAMTYQVENDINSTKRLFYRCQASRPGDSNNTTNDTISVETEEFSFAVMPRISDKYIKASSPGDSAVEATWDASIYEPTEIPGV